MHDSVVKILSVFLSVVFLPLHAGDIVTQKRISPDLALEMVKHAVEACRQDGYQVTALVVAS